jgi:DNA-binding MarR family transcriptional regulator
MAPTPTNPTRDAGMKIRKLGFLMDRLADQTLRESANLSFAQFRILRMLMHAGALSQKAIASWHGLTDAAVSRQVDDLVKEKLVIRQINPANRREHILMLTPTGTRQAEKAKLVLGKKFNGLFSVLPVRERRQLETSLERLLEAIWEEHGRVLCGKPGLGLRGHHPFLKAT